MPKILDYKYNKFDMVQLEESEIRRLIDFMKENEIKFYKYDGSLTIALEYSGIKFVCVYYSAQGAVKKSPSEFIALMPEKIVSASCWSGPGEDHYLTGGICETTGDKELDELFAQAAYYAPLYEETSFGWLIEKQSDGSDKYDEYEEEYERLRSEIIEYEQSMQKKYLTEDMLRNF